ncbi:DUF6882 domain-containing protein [Kosakonia cowanii]|uniref:DUF6882 domain-containing protein n=1 Tax=Kosakonia cowanii TaxID=208223 RepID=UPI003F6982C9
MANFFKKWFGGGNDKAKDEVLREPDLTIARANNEMQQRTQAATEMWGIDSAEWGVDLDAGTITFTNHEKGWVITAPVQVVGTYDTEEGSWLWGWDHPSVREPLGEYAACARTFGEQHGLEALTTRQISASTEDAWTFTALACHLGGGQGGYSGLAGTTRVFMVYDNVTINKQA